jgi:phosphate transport system permease protein
MANAIVGTLILIALGALIAVPTGIGAGLYLAEYGHGRFATAVRYACDLLAGVPSIVVGVAAYGLVVIPMGRFSALAGGVALSILMLPTIVRSTEEVVRLVPRSYREAALALGAPRWKVIQQVVLPAASAGVITATLLAVARAAGETAPLLFTAATTHNTDFNLSHFMNSLPVQIYNDVTSPTTAVVNRAWGAALALVTLILLINLIARLVASRSRLA